MLNLPLPFPPNLKKNGKWRYILVANKMRIWLHSWTTNDVANLPNAVKSGLKWGRTLRPHDISSDLGQDGRLPQSTWAYPEMLCKESLSDVSSRGTKGYCRRRLSPKRARPTAQLMADENEGETRRHTVFLHRQAEVRWDEEPGGRQHFSNYRPLKCWKLRDDVYSQVKKKNRFGERLEEATYCSSFPALLPFPYRIPFSKYMSWTMIRKNPPIWTCFDMREKIKKKRM